MPRLLQVHFISSQTTSKEFYYSNFHEKIINFSNFHDCVWCRINNNNRANVLWRQILIEKCVQAVAKELKAWCMSSLWIQFNVNYLLYAWLQIGLICFYEKEKMFKGKVRSFFSMRFEIKIINLWHKASSSGFHCTVAVNCCCFAISLMTFSSSLIMN